MSNVSNNGTGSSGIDSGGSMSNVSNNGTGSSGIDTTEKTSTYSVGTSIRIGKDSGDSDRGSSSFLISITPLPLSSRLLRGSGGSSSIISSSEFSLSGSNLSGILYSNWEGKVENGSSEGLDSGGSSGNREVGSGNSESVDGISDVVNSLQKTISINVLVRSGGYSVGIAGLGTG